MIKTVEYSEQIDLPTNVIEMFLAEYRAQLIGINEQISGLERQRRALGKVIKKLEDVRCARVAEAVYD